MRRKVPTTTPPGDEPPAPPDRVVLRGLYQELRVQLTDEEHRAKGVLLAQEVGNLRDLKDANKAKRATMKQEEDDQQTTVLELQQDVADRSEIRSVQCEEIADYKVGVVEVIRVDTKQVVDYRPMTAAERQLQLGPDPLPPEPLPFERPKGKLKGISPLPPEPGETDEN